MAAVVRDTKKKGRRVMAKDQLRPPSDTRPEAVLGRLLKDWVEQERAAVKTLQRWLYGYGLPPLGDDEGDEPFLWLLDGCTEYPNGKKSLAEAVMKLLTDRPAPPDPDETNRYWFNLLMLAEGLGTPKLRPVLKKFAEEVKLEGTYRGIRLRQVTLTAAGLPLERSQEGFPDRPFPVADPASTDPCLAYLTTLDSGGCTATVLRRWLGGRLPFGKEAPYAGKAAYVRLIGNIPLGSKHYDRKVALAEAARDLLNEFRGKVGRSDVRMANNLLLLCGQLRLADILCQPLCQWIGDRKLPLRLRESLRSGVLNNQRDNSLKEVWLDMLRGKPTVLPADTDAALEAVRLMPLSANRQSMWDLESISKALGLAAANMTAETFSAYLHRIDNTYPHLQGLETCARRDWPAWAVAELGIYLLYSPKSPNRDLPVERFDSWFTKDIAPKYEVACNKGVQLAKWSAPSLYKCYKTTLKKVSESERVNWFAQCLQTEQDLSRGSKSANAANARKRLYEQVLYVRAFKEVSTAE